MTDFGDTDPSTAVARMLDRAKPVGVLTEPLHDPADVVGRVLAEPLLFDRDSPACDVSAMDGFAIRWAELQAGRVSVAGECRIGEAPADLPAATAKRIYTGSPVPTGADTVVRLEWVDESPEGIQLREGRDLRQGQDIRRCGENAAAGDEVLAKGVELTTAAIGALASIGPRQISLHRKLRVTVLTTGDEVVSHQESTRLGAEFPAWRLRNSNGPVLVALIGGLPFVESVTHTHAVDARDELVDSLAAAAASSDVVVLTGGVSKGAYDFVRGAVEQLGGDVLFHGVTARPGRPTLGAIVGEVPVMGLPGNPVAVLTTSRRLLAPVLRRRAGISRATPPAPLIKLGEWRGKTLPLSWWRPVTLTGPGLASLASLRGSGDVCGPASTDGFIEAPPNADDSGPFPFYSWRL